MNEEELTELSLAEAARLDGRINSFITVLHEAAMQQARQAEAELARGERTGGQPLGALHGLPIALKDLFETAGVRTTAGSKFFGDHYPTRDAVVVSRLKSAGAILLGKNNMHEIALGLTTVNPHFGACHNPWKLDCVPGGSSGGSAAALAARFCLGAMGSDTGGSIRVPAALCGVVGLKPTYGRVSLGGVIPLSWNLDHAGPMARQVLDVAMLLQVTAGYDPDDPVSVNMPTDDYVSGIQQGVAGWRVLLAEDEYFDRTHPEIAQAVRQAAETLEELGAKVETAPLPGAREAASTNGTMVVSDAAAYHAERLREQPEGFGADVLQRLQIGAALPLVDYIRARRAQVEMRRQFARLFDRCDLLLLPTTPIAAPSISGPDALEMARWLTRYTAPFNLTGLPALSLPCGFTTDGLPIGLQMVARPWGEAAILQAGYAYEQATTWRFRQPELS
jgi:aspartyl-tRNA(Asn)/glutamyl-tRNA(Gln) amidotransferase subunit A